MSGQRRLRVVRRGWRITVVMACLGALAAVSTPPAGAAGAAGEAAPRATLAWRGLQGDYVSRAESNRPDGSKDGHFTLVVDPGGPVSITAIEVRITDRTGTANGSQIWDTIPGNGLWALGGVWHGKHVNALGQGFGLGFSTRQVIELYCGDSGYFTRGATFRATVTLAGGRTLKALATIGAPAAAPAAPAAAPAAAAQAAEPRVTLAWAGGSADVVGTGGTGGPDGAADMHWTAVLDLGAATRTVTGIQVDSATAAGARDGVAYWNTTPDYAWILGVVLDGKRVNPTDAAISVPLSGRHTLALYGAMAGNTPRAPGQVYLITVTFAEGGPATATARI